MDRLFFFSGSADVPPGQGVHEQVADAGDYAGLAAVRQWRRMLSNFWPAEFTLAGRTYRTVEHAFQAAKIGLADAGLAAHFALESGTELARGDGLTARRHRKMMLLSDDQLRTWDAEKDVVLQDAMAAKFGSHPGLRAVLLATGPAELWHSAGRGQPPARVHTLEAVRGPVPAAPGS